MHIETVTMMKEDYDKQLELIKESRNIIAEILLGHGSMLNNSLLITMHSVLGEMEMMLRGKN